MIKIKWNSIKNENRKPAAIEEETELNTMNDELLTSIDNRFKVSRGKKEGGHFYNQTHIKSIPLVEILALVRLLIIEEAMIKDIFLVDAFK